MSLFGCSVTDLAMLFQSYGIKNVPLGSPAYPATTQPFNPPAGLDGSSLDPGSLNYAMANYTTDLISVGSVGFNSNNDPLWAGAADVARAGYEAQCGNPSNLCSPANAPNIISYKYALPPYASTQAAISGIQNDICSGNPVILKFSKASGGQHFMLATGIVLDGNNNQTIQLNNPGTKNGEGQLYSKLLNSYPSFIGGELYRPSADPTMMFIAAPLNVHFVVTDPQGRQTGYNPITGTTYAEIPGATYELQSINTPNETGFTPQTLVAERYFTNSVSALTGNYQVTVYAVSAGSYYIDYRGFDATGTTNKSIIRKGTLSAGQTATVTVNQSDAAAPVPNAKITLREYSIRDFKKIGLADATVHVVGNISSFSKSNFVFGSAFSLGIGGVGEYSLRVPASNFKTRKLRDVQIYEYHAKYIDMVVDSRGDFDLKVRDANLTSVNQNEIGLISITTGNFIGQTNSELMCDKDECHLPPECNKEQKHGFNNERGSGHR
jgi:hypothetical protein